jgi:hypothetical protein
MIDFYVVFKPSQIKKPTQPAQLTASKPAGSANWSNDWNDVFENTTTDSSNYYFQ